MSIQQSTDATVLSGDELFEENQFCAHVPSLWTSTMELYTNVILPCESGPLRGRYLLLQKVEANYMMLEEVDVLIKKVFAPGMKGFLEPLFAISNWALISGELYLWDRRSDKGNHGNKPNLNGSFRRDRWLLDGEFTSRTSTEVLSDFDFGHAMPVAIVDVHVDDPKLNMVRTTYKRGDRIYALKHT